MEHEELGGADPRDNEREEKDKGYCDKGGHKERSIANDPKHERHWQKEQRDEKRDGRR